MVCLEVIIIPNRKSEFWGAGWTLRFSEWVKFLLAPNRQDGGGETIAN